MGRRCGLPALPPERPEEPARLALARAVRLMREDGALYQTIAAAFGISTAYVGELLHDPTGQRARRRHERARGICQDCGRPTAWPGGDGAPRRCLACVRRLQRILPAHGSTARYRRGCRCEACRAANTRYCRERFRWRYRHDPAFRARVLEANRAAWRRRRAA